MFKIKFPPNMAYEFSDDKAQVFLKWPNGHITQNLAQYMGLSGEINIVSELKLPDGEIKTAEFARGKIAIMCGGLVKYKSFPVELANEIIAKVPDYDFIQIGISKDQRITGATYMSGKFSLRETAAVLKNCELFIGLIGGLMHLVRTVGTPSVIAYGAEPANYDTYACNIQIFSRIPCDKCPTNLIMPLTQLCPCNTNA
jgi:ADP-heptose:LPS heptosyltransferase